MKNEKKKCLECDKQIEGRSDKKFCDAYCRNAYNNKNKKEDEHYIYTINSKLRKNRSILKSLNPQGKSTVRKDYLCKLGFDFKFHTDLYTTNRGNTYFFCYEYGYLLIEDEKVLLVIKQNYMK